jgi:hypothetical protein
MMPRLNEAIGGQSVGLRELTEHHRDFVACVAPGTTNAILRHLVGQGIVVGDAEIEMFEEGGNACEQADALDAAGLGLMEKGADEKAACSTPFGFRVNDDGANLREVLTVDMECSAADELMGGGFDDGEGADVGADLRIGAAEQGTVGGEAVDQLMDIAGVL